MKTWKVLPTNPDFLKLTDEQKEWLWEDYLLDNPEIARKTNKLDQDFEDEWNMSDPDNPESKKFEDEDYNIDISDKFEKFVEDNNLNDVKRSPESQAILDQINSQRNEEVTNFDWEDVDDTDWEEVDD